MAKATKPLNAPKINDTFPNDKINANFKGRSPLNMQNNRDYH